MSVAMDAWMAMNAAMVLGSARRMDGDRGLDVDGDGRVISYEHVNVAGDGHGEGHE